MLVIANGATGAAVDKLVNLITLGIEFPQLDVYETFILSPTTAAALLLYFILIV